MVKLKNGRIFEESYFKIIIKEKACTTCEFIGFQSPENRYDKVICIKCRNKDKYKESEIVEE